MNLEFFRGKNRSFYETKEEKPIIINNRCFSLQNWDISIVYINNFMSTSEFLTNKTIQEKSYTS